jgi:hypothetical protein
MNTRLFGVLIGVVGIAAFAAGCGKAVESDNTNNENTTTVTNDVYDINAVLANIVTNDTNSDVENTNTINENTNTLNSNTSLNTNSVSNRNTNTISNTNSVSNTNTAPSTSTITVTAPLADAELVSPFTVEGTATGTEVYARVRSANGTAIFTEKISVNNGKFKGKLLFDFTTTRAGSLDIFQKDSSGTETNLVTVPVTFAKAGTTNTNTTSN